MITVLSEIILNGVANSGAWCYYTEPNDDPG